MSPQLPASQPVSDTVPKVDNAVAVGEDLEFQRRWWRFERVIWVVFGLILLADALGLFGRGLLANANRETADRTLALKYERVARASTPSILTITIGEPALHDGHARLFVSESVVHQLGNQRIIPQPASSTTGSEGITYDFPVSSAPARVSLELQPSFPGVHPFTIQVPGAEPIHASITVVP